MLLSLGVSTSSTAAVREETTVYTRKAVRASGSQRVQAEQLENIRGKQYDPDQRGSRGGRGASEAKDQHANL